ncbi:hypothetical protein [Parasphingorhabdus cellanae]|uniref:Uncharacterized protein n=1 Tax=Parasphingorhabdus cellanae TaxID=2806553 RepID=A0ABX7T6V3_9SPHN|nr:hypothetical protein [Parasphingorhabdus cellanae]QTD56643.1 hypothetical protein J4G78_03365 [Parasphingorhabdus cellanae]
MRNSIKLAIGSCATALLFSAPAQAQKADPDQSMEEHAEDAATTPARDVGLKKTKIPEKLIAIQDDPYSLDGLRRCAAIINEVEELDVVLAPDVNEEVDKSKAEKREETAGRVAGGIIGGLIPFRGIVREISGAAGDERKYNAAVYAGVVRRGFLKGVGRERGCKAPARP